MKKSLPESSIFEQKIKFFRPRCWNAEFRGLGEDLGLDFGGLGKVLGSSRGVLGPTTVVLGPTLAPKSLHEGSHTTQRKKLENHGSQNQRSAARGLDLWGRGKTADSEKSIAKVSLNTGENANPAKWRKHGVNQGR